MTIVPLRSQDPFLDKLLRLSQRTRTWINAVTDLQILTGSGSPECVVSARSDRLYRDTANSSDLYIKDVDEIARDKTKGWKLIANPVETITTASVTSLGLTNELIICNNTSAITITLHELSLGGRVSVVRANTGAVAIDGGGANIIGRSKITLLSRYDVANMFALDSEWVLDK